MLEAYHQHVADRAKLGISPLPLNAQQTQVLLNQNMKNELLHNESPALTQKFYRP